jgi:peptidyl-prolyl cis-trans isomerase D
MFDLFRRKDTNLRVLLGVLLGLVAFSMVITLIPGFGSAGFGLPGGEENVAKVCGEPVTSREVRIKLQQMLNRTQLPPDSAAIFIPQFVDQLVNVKAVACFAEERGMLASDEAVAKKIQKDVPALWQNGKFVGAQMYEMMLKSSGITVKEFEDSVKKEIETTRLRAVMLMSSVATPQEVEKAFRDAEESVKIEYTVIDPVEVGKGLAPSEAEARENFEKNKQNYMSEEYRKVNMIVFDPARFQSTIQVSDDQARRYYNENLDSFRTAERSHVKHILFKTQGKAETEDAKMKALAESTFKQIKGGAKFEDLAKKYSEDPGSKDRGGDIGFITRGQTVKNFEETSFSAPVGQLVGPIKTEFGYHLIEVIERQNAQVISFDEARARVIEDLKRQTAADSLGRAADQLRRDIEKNPSQLLALASKVGAGIVGVEYKGSGTPLPVFGPKPEMFNVVQRLRKGQVSEVQTIDDKTVLFQVDTIVPKAPSTFEEARSAVMSQLQAAAGQKKVEELRQKAVAGVSSASGDIAKLAKELGTPVKTTQMFARSGFADGIGPASAVIDGFTKPVGEVWGPFTVDNKWFVAKVVEKKAADMSLLPARRVEMINIVKNRKAAERSDIFEDTLMKSMMEDGEIKVNETVKKRLATNSGV